MKSNRMKFSILSTAAITIGLTACVTSPSTPSPPPSYVTSPTACALVLGGGGMLFGDKGVDEIWFKINSAVSSGTVEELRGRGYKIEALIIPAQSSSERAALMGKAMADHQCSKLVQIAHVKESGLLKTEFGFDVEILYPSASDSSEVQGGRTYKFLSEYKKQYRYPFTDSVFQTLSLSGVGKNIAKDIDEANVIKNKMVK